MPRCQMTAITEQVKARSVSLCERVPNITRAQVTRKATPKNRTTPAAPSAMSPIALAKPTMWISTASSWNSDTKDATSSSRATWR